MRKIIFVLIAALVVSVSITGTVESQSLKKAKEKITKKTEKKKAPAAASGNVVLAKGLQLSWCGNNVTSKGSITMPGLTNVTLSVANGKFDLTLPANPVFSDDEWELSQHREYVELDFGSAKVYPIIVLYFNNTDLQKKSNNDFDERGRANGRGFLSFQVYYSEIDVKGTVNGEPVELKKGWNIFGDKDAKGVLLMCAG